MPYTKPKPHALQDSYNPDILRIVQYTDFPIATADKKVHHDGWTPLHDAISKKNWAGAQSLVSQMTNGGTSNGWSITHMLAQFPEAPVDLIKAVLEKANMAGNNVGINPLHVAAYCGNITFITEALPVMRGKGMDLKGGNKDSLHALHFAALNNQVDAINLLCKEVPGIHERGDKFGFSAAHFAAAKGHWEALECLFANGIHQSVGNSVGMRLSHVAAHYNQLGVITKLDHNTYDLNEQNTTPLHLAVKADKTGDHLGVIRFLSTHHHSCHEDINCTDKNGDNPVAIAAYEHHNDVLSYFLATDSSLKEGFNGLTDLPQDALQIIGAV